MGKSLRKTKIHAITTAKSEKQDKQQANRKLRRIVKNKLKSGDISLPKIREVSDVWSFDKDGKIYCKDMFKEDMRK